MPNILDRKMRDMSDRIDNIIRCSIALTAPQIVATAFSCRGDIPQDSRLFPKYILEGHWSGTNFFTYVDGRLQGKKRVYISSDGTRIMYLTRKMLNRYRGEVSREACKDDLVILDKLSDRWVIVKMPAELINRLPKHRSDFLSLIRQGLVEIKSSKSNHPPTGSGKFGKLLDSMEASDVTLKEYRLP